MAITAFSKKLGVELGASQYLEKMGHDIKSDPELQNISEEERRVIKDDIICPSCRAGNAIIVSGSRSLTTNLNIREAHFRFINSDGKNAHGEFCDLREDKPFNDSTVDKINFLEPRTQSKTTKLIGKIVTKALNNGLISVSQMIEFREWHYNLKKDNIVSINFDSEKIFPYHVFLCRKNSTSDMLIESSKTETNIRKSELDYFVGTNKATLEKISKHRDFKVKPKPIENFLKKKNKDIFDVRKLINEYTMVRDLSSGLNSALKIYRSGMRDKSLIDAFSGLILFTCNWDINKAVDKCNEILKSEESDEKIMGNIIGLNPFYKFELYASLLNINDVHDALPTIEELRQI